MKIILILVALFVKTHAALPFSRIPPSLENAVEHLARFHETRHFMESVKGPIDLYWHPLAHARALWIGRIGMGGTIILNSNMDWNEGKKISSILFELHNAKANNELASLEHRAKMGQLSKWEFVRSVEWIEYKNALYVHEQLERGIQEHYFPQEARFCIYNDFKRHLALQIKSGHSQILANRFGQLVGDPAA